MEPGRQELLNRIVALEFTAVELGLFLDTHPEEPRALADFNVVSEELRRLKETYEQRYGPLLNYGFSPSPQSWRWIEEPWPWQVSM